jgi:hypothetical protein
MVKFKVDKKKYELKRTNQGLIDISRALVGITYTGGKSYFTSNDGWEKQKAQFQFAETNIIFLDADQSYAQTLLKVSQTINIPGFPFSTQLYLWPDNQGQGTLEDLLETIINPDNQPILDCWSSFEQCISTLPGKSLTLPANKTKIYAYLETLLGTTNNEKEKIKERNRDYTNTAHWNLDPTHKNLQPLKTFLDQHLLAK